MGDAVPAQVLNPNAGYIQSTSNTSTMSTMSTSVFSRHPYLVVAAVLVLVLLLVVWYYSKNSLAAKLTKNGWVVYYQKGCPHCVHQKKLLKWFSNYVECDSTGKTTHTCKTAPYQCGNAAITAYPFWVNTNTNATMVGFQNAASLATMAKPVKSS